MLKNDQKSDQKMTTKKVPKNDQKSDQNIVIELRSVYFEFYITQLASKKKQKLIKFNNVSGIVFCVYIRRVF